MEGTKLNDFLKYSFQSALRVTRTAKDDINQSKSVFHYIRALDFLCRGSRSSSLSSLGSIFFYPRIISLWILDVLLDPFGLWN